MSADRSSLAPVAKMGSDADAVIERSFSEKRPGGPKTLAGKRRSSRNSLKAGLYSSATVIRSESEAEYFRFARAIVAGLDVQNPVEMAIAERLVSALWRARRARRFEAAHLNALIDEAEEKREALQRAEEVLCDQRQAYKAILGLRYGEGLSAEELSAAACALHDIYRQDPDAVYHEDVDDPEPPSRFWTLFPERNVSRKRATVIAEEVYKIFCGSRPGIPVQEFWTWVLQKAAAHEQQAKALRDEAARKCGIAMRGTFILDTILEGEGWVKSTVEAARILADAEGRLDRQVSRAIADLKAARELRGRPE